MGHIRGVVAHSQSSVYY